MWRGGGRASSSAALGSSVPAEEERGSGGLQPALRHAGPGLPAFAVRRPGRS